MRNPSGPKKSILKSIFLKNVLAKTVSHRNLQKLPRYLALISCGSFCKFLCETVLASIFLRKIDFRRDFISHIRIDTDFFSEATVTNKIGSRLTILFFLEFWSKMEREIIQNLCNHKCSV